MRLLFFSLSLFFLIPLVSSAQSQLEDVVYLKNGGVLRGEIIEMNRNEWLKIEIAGRNIFVVMMDEVSEIKTEVIPFRRHYKEAGYINRSGVDLLSGQGSSSIRIYTVNGYQFTPGFSAGFGLGVSTYNDPLTLIPFFADLNYRLIESNTLPFIFVKFGYNFSINHDDDFEIDDHRGGLLFNAGVGIVFNLSSGFGWYINAGYNIDNSSYEFDTWNNQTVNNNLSFRRVNFGVGFAF